MFKSSEVSTFSIWFDASGPSGSSHIKSSKFGLILLEILAFQDYHAFHHPRFHQIYLVK